LASKNTYIIQSNLQIETICKILKTEFDLVTDSTNLQFKQKSIGHPIIGSMAISNCDLKQANGNTSITITFQKHPVFYFALIICLIFAILSLILFFIKEDFMQLIGTLPIVTIIPILYLIYKLDKTTKLNRFIKYLNNKGL
jgi:hypothetical protein